MFCLLTGVVHNAMFVDGVGRRCLLTVFFSYLSGDRAS